MEDINYNEINVLGVKMKSILIGDQIMEILIMFLMKKELKQEYTI